MYTCDDVHVAQQLLDEPIELVGDGSNLGSVATLLGQHNHSTMGVYVCMHVCAWPTAACQQALPLQALALHLPPRPNSGTMSPQSLTLRLLAEDMSPRRPMLLVISCTNICSLLSL